jgi:hypothetical protein
MFVNEYVTKFTQLSRYAPHELDTAEKKQECFLNGLNDGRAYALEDWDFENFERVVNKTLVLENHRGVMGCKRKLVHQHCQVEALGRMLLHIKLELCSVLVNHSFSRGRRQLDKDFLPHSIK